MSALYPRLRVGSSEVAVNFLLWTGKAQTQSRWDVFKHLHGGMVMCGMRGDENCINNVQCNARVV